VHWFYSLAGQEQARAVAAAPGRRARPNDGYQLTGEYSSEIEDRVRSARSNSDDYDEEDD
jgi:hypothetical protein